MSIKGNFTLAAGTLTAIAAADYYDAPGTLFCLGIFVGLPVAIAARLTGESNKTMMKIAASNIATMTAAAYMMEGKLDLLGENSPPQEIEVIQDNPHLTQDTSYLVAKKSINDTFPQYQV